LSFCRWAIQHPAFVSGDFDTHFVKHYFNADVLKREDEDASNIAVLAALKALLNQKKQSAITDDATPASSWKSARTTW
jgi:propionyl-CoA carboxylase alpha chain